jgi:sugar phosphate isomerase/epimerase
MHTVGNTNLTRRHFLSVVVGGCAATAWPIRTWSEVKPIATGIQLYTVGADLTRDPAATLKQIAKIGYTEVETAGFAKLSASQFRALLNDAGLHAPSAHLMFGMADTNKLLDDAKTIGADYVVSSVLLPHPPEPGNGAQGFLKTLNALTEDDFKQIAGKANEIGRQAKAAGLQYAYHNHNFEFRDLGGGVKGYDILLRETDPALVKFEADCGWMRVAGQNPLAYLKREPGRFVMLHIKDFKNVTKPVTALMAPDTPTPTELGRGDIDLKPVIEAGRIAGIKHVFVEQEPPFTEMTPLQAAEVNFKYLHPLLT